MVKSEIVLFLQEIYQRPIKNLRKKNNENRDLMKLSHLIVDKSPIFPLSVAFMLISPKVPFAVTLSPLVNVSLRKGKASGTLSMFLQRSVSFPFEKQISESTMPPDIMDMNLSKANLKSPSASSFNSRLLTFMVTSPFIGKSFPLVILSLGRSTRHLRFFSWLLDHVIYLKLRKKDTVGTS